MAPAPTPPLPCGQRAALTELLPQRRSLQSSLRRPLRALETGENRWNRIPASGSARPQGPKKQMGRPGPLRETISAAQLSGVPAAVLQAPGDAARNPEDSDLGRSVALAVALALLFLLLSAWLGWGGPVHRGC